MLQTYFPMSLICFVQLWQWGRWRASVASNTRSYDLLWWTPFLQLWEGPRNPKPHSVAQIKIETASKQIPLMHFLSISLHMPHFLVCLHTVCPLRSVSPTGGIRGCRAVLQWGHGSITISFCLPFSSRGNRTAPWDTYIWKQRRALTKPGTCFWIVVLNVLRSDLHDISSGLGWGLLKKSHATVLQYVVCACLWHTS